MILDSNNLLFYLLHRGVLNRGEIVDGVSLHDVSPSQNPHRRVFRVLGKDRSFLVEQAAPGAPQEVQRLQRQAVCSRLTENDDFALLQPYLPAFRHADPAANILALAFVPGDSLAVHHARHDSADPESVDLESVDPELAAELGEMLGGWHRVIRISAGDHRVSPLFAGRPPWILTLPRQPFQGNWIAQTVAQDPALRGSLESLAASYRVTHLIHGDIHWQKLLVVPGEKPRLRLVGWGQADAGDPGWDLGSVIHTYLVPCVLWANRESFSLPAVQPALGQLWRAYRSARGLDDDGALDTLNSVLRFAAARLIQTSFELGPAGPHAAQLLQLSQNIFLKTGTGPEGTQEVARDLLGVEEP